MKKDEALVASGAYVEYDKWVRHNMIGISIVLVTALLTFHLIYPLHVLIFVRHDDAGALMTLGGRWDECLKYFGKLGSALMLRIMPGDFYREYYLGWMRAMGAGKASISLVWLGWLGTIVLGAAVTVASNKNRKNPNIFGDSRFAVRKDIDEMEKRNLVGFKAKLFLVGKFEKELVRMGETLSILILAPPGTGKTAGFIVPSAVSMDKTCLFFHDQKPELFDMTSGHRSKCGPVFQLRWSAQDEPRGFWANEDQAKLICPDLIEKGEDGKSMLDDTGRVKTKPIYYPSWNPLSPKSIPGAGPRRDMYIERLVNVLCPDPTGGGDKFWTSKARAALIGLIHFLCAKVEHAQDSRLGGTWDGIPEKWRGREASFPMLVETFAYAQIQFDDGSDDPMRQMFKAWVDEARRMDEKYNQVYGSYVLGRSAIELTSLMNSPDKTRGSIIQTLDESMGAFKNEAVIQRTSYSDFAFYELRGMPKPEAKAREMEKVALAREEGRIYKPRYDKKTEFLPVSVYVSVSSEDAKAFATITGIFIDSANAYLVANGPNAIDDQNNQNGPFDFCFLIDEAPQLPKLDTVINGPAVGRSKRISYIIVGQDFGQFEQKYSKPEVETLKSTTAIKVILSQNNENAAKSISEMAGKSTFKKFSYSQKGGPNIGVLGQLFSGMSASESYEGTEFLKPSFIMSMPQDKHIVLVQNYMNRPILADTPKFFMEKDIGSKVYNLRDFSGPAPTSPMPKALMDEAAGRYEERHAVAAVVAEKREAENDPRRVIIVTPRDIQSLTRDNYGEMLEKTGMYACAEVFLQENECFVERPPEDSVLITDRLEDVIAFVGRSRYFVFDDATLETEINAKLRDKGKSALPEDYAEFVASRAKDVGETPGQDVYFLGFQGGAGLDLPESPDVITPNYTVNWVVEIINFVMGIEEQKRLFEL